MARAVIYMPGTVYRSNRSPKNKPVRSADVREFPISWNTDALSIGQPCHTRRPKEIEQFYGIEQRCGFKGTFMTAQLTDY